MEIKIHDWNIWSCRIDEWSYYISFCNVNSGFIAACTFYFLHICERNTENSKIWLMNWGWWPHPSWSNAQSTSLIKSGNDVEQKRRFSSFDKRSRANKWEVELKANHAFGQLWCTPFICFPEVLTNYLVADMKKAHTHTHKWHFCFSLFALLYFSFFFFFSLVFAWKTDRIGIDVRHRACVRCGSANVGAIAHLALIKHVLRWWKTMGWRTQSNQLY